MGLGIGGFGSTPVGGSSTSSIPVHMPTGTASWLWGTSSIPPRIVGGSSPVASSIPFRVLINRTSLGLGALVLPQPGKFELVTVSDGVLGWQHDEQHSIFVHGSLRVSSTEIERKGEIQMRVKGASSAAMWANISELIQALTQLHYTVTFFVGSQQDFWDDCGPAEYALGGGYNTFGLMAKQEEYTFHIPYSPVSYTGV